MDRASSLIYPGSKILAGWWRQLQPRQPSAFQVGYGFVHRIEAPVQVLRSQPIDSFTHLILHAVSLEEARNSPVLLDTLHQRLLLPPAVLHRILLELAEVGLLTESLSAGWQTTERGRAAIERREYPLQVRERRTFAFIERLDPTGQRTQPPLFLPLTECPAAVWQATDSHRFEPVWLHECVAQSSDWKRLWSFSGDIEAVAQEAAAPAWQNIIVDRPERVLFLLTRTGPGDAGEWLAFAAKADGWILYEQTPILRLPAFTNTLEQDLTGPPPLAVWNDAWRAWCRERNLPANEVDLCTLSYQPPRLEVRAPERLVQRLRAAKSDLLKGDAWLLVGDGYLRTAALLTCGPAVAL